MSSENLLIHCKPVQGYNKIFDKGEYKMELTTFGLIKLASGTKYKGNTGDCEVALVLMGGNFKASGDGWEFTVTDGRKNPFSGKPYCLYMPRNTAYELEGLSDVEFAYNAAPATRDTAKPTLLKPENSRHIEIGKDNWFRTSEIILDEKFDSEHFYIGEGMIPSGNWSGYPPHRHDIDNLPEEIDMEETYFYLFNPQQGFGIQKVYKPDGSLDETYTVKNYDTVAIKEGYHPLCGAPGYQMYYLWTMAGEKNRGLISSKDPAHSWVK